MAQRIDYNKTTLQARSTKANIINLPAIQAILSNVVVADNLSGKETLFLVSAAAFYNSFST